MIDINQKLLESRCREIVTQYSDILLLIQKEIETELEREEINEDTSFLTAKRYIRQRSIKEGITKLLAKLNKYSDGRK